MYYISCNSHITCERFEDIMLFMLYVMTKYSGHKLSLKCLWKRTENKYCHYILPKTKTNDVAELRPQICDYMHAKLI